MSTNSLHDFEGRDVTQATIKIVKAGDGLSEAIGIAPTEFHIGDEGYVVLHYRCTKVNYEAIRDTEALRRVHTFSTLTATTLDDDAASEAIERQRIAIEEAKGVTRLPLDDGDFDDEDAGR